MRKIKQISYSNWANGPKQYWKDVGTLAFLIASGLTHTYSDGRKVSTIRVSQYKEKFGQVRVYCNLADPQLIQEKYQLASTENIPEPISKACLLDDARHYRQVYSDIISLTPQYKSIIIGGADYSELLMSSKELPKFLDDQKKNDSKYHTHIFNLSSIEELSTFLHKVYNLIEAT